ncbi:MAG: GMC family oxidoreductase [Pseudorhodobacter sp. PARRP1]|nr:MAG: GMC family oxidoreductase [Pseudorhodobacter sp. PARRP1]
MESFDYIVVGAGSGGATVARRLVDANKSVLLLEAGPTDRVPFVHIPGGFIKVIGTKRTWPYVSEPEPGAKNRVMHIPQGRMLGGSSSVNAMIYIRGDAQDYDDWAAGGAVGWSHQEVLPYFRKAEANQRLADEYHGTDGPLRVSDPSYRHPLAYAFLRAAQQTGLPLTQDFNGAKQEGVGFYQTTTFNGRRGSTAVCYLDPVRGNPRMTIRTNAHVERLVLEGDEVKGITCRMANGQVQTFTARHEVVLSAGALASPKILMLSGIGAEADLAPHGIAVQHRLDGVGQGYQDHVAASVYGGLRDPIGVYGADKGLRAVRHMLQYLFTRTGLLTSNIIECGGFLDTTGAGRPDVQLHVVPTMLGDADREAPQCHGISMNPCCLRPTSRGSMTLRSADPRDLPVLHAMNLTTREDVETVMRGVTLCRKILKAPALAALVREELAPGPKGDTPESLEDHVRQFAKTVYHPSCTAHMGTDDMAVTDPQLRVRGIKRLRIADASVMPRLVSGNTNAPCVMIGERCADFMLR